MRGKIIDIANQMQVALTRFTAPRAANLDHLNVGVDTRAPADSAVDNAYWTNALGTALTSFLATPPPSTTVNRIQSGYVNVNSGSWSTGSGQDAFYTDITITSVDPAKAYVLWQTADGKSMARVYSATILRVSQITNSPGQLVGLYQVVELK